MAGHFERLMHVLLTPASRAFQKTFWQPPADIYRLARGWLVKFELAGVRPEDVRRTTTFRLVERVEEALSEALAGLANRLNPEAAAA